MSNYLALQARGPSVRPARNRAAAQQSHNMMMQQQSAQMEMAAKKVRLTGEVLGAATSQEDFISRINQGVEGGFLSPQEAERIASEPWSPQLSAKYGEQALTAYQRAGLADSRAERAYRMYKDSQAAALDAEQKGYDRGRDARADELAANERVYRRERDTRADERADAELGLKAAALSATSGKSRQDQQKFEFNIGKQYRTESKPFKEVSSATARLVKSLDKAPFSAPATLAAATAFMKMLDPGSVVRESELGAALAATGLLDRITNLAKQTDYGRVMTVRQQAQFMEMAREFYAEAEREQRQVDAEYGGIADEYGLNKKNILSNYYLPQDMFPDAPVENNDLPEISNQADFDALASGTRFVDPGGNIREKP